MSLFSFPVVFQLSSVLMVAVGLIKLLARPSSDTAWGQWAMCGAVCLVSVVWLMVVLGAFKALFGFSPVLGGTLIAGF